MSSVVKKITSVFKPRSAPKPVLQALPALPAPVRPQIIQIPAAAPVIQQAAALPAPVKVQNASLTAEATGTQRVSRSRTAGGTSALKFAPLGGGRSKRSGIKRSVLGGS